MVLMSLPGAALHRRYEEWLQITGYSREQVIGRTAEEVALIEPHERAVLYAGRVTQGRRNVDLRFRTASGELRHGLVSMSGWR